MKGETLKAVVSVVCVCAITTLELSALLIRHIDGAGLAAATAAIGAIGGWWAKKVRQ